MKHSLILKDLKSDVFYIVYYSFFSEILQLPYQKIICLIVIICIIVNILYIQEKRRKKDKKLKQNIEKIVDILFLNEWEDIGAKCFIYEVDNNFLETNFDTRFNKLDFVKEEDVLSELQKMAKFFKLWRESFIINKFGFVCFSNGKYFINNKYIVSLINDIQENGENEDNSEEYDLCKFFLKSHDCFYNFVCHLNKLQKLINKRFNGKIKSFEDKFQLNDNGMYNEDGEPYYLYTPEKELKKHITFWKYEN